LSFGSSIVAGEKLLILGRTSRTILNLISSIFLQVCLTLHVDQVR